jgi:hypothetical protein
MIFVLLNFYVILCNFDFNCLNLKYLNFLVGQRHTWIG